MSIKIRLTHGLHSQTLSMTYGICGRIYNIYQYCLGNRVHSVHQVVCHNLKDIVNASPVSDCMAVSAAAAVIGVSGKLEAALQPMAHATAKSRHTARQLQMHASPMGHSTAIQSQSNAIGGEASRVVCIGLGGGSLPNFLSHHFPGMLIDAVELDPLVITAASDHMGFPQHRCVTPLSTSPMPCYHMTLPEIGGLQMRPFMVIYSAFCPVMCTSLWSVHRGFCGINLPQCHLHM